MNQAEAAPEIRVRGLCKTFGSHAVLRGVDLLVRRGEMVAIVGGSGCGKTVLLNHILGQLRPDAGTVEVADHDLPGAPLVDISHIPERRKDAIHTHWGVVFQRNALFSGSVYENIALWLEEVQELTDTAIRPIARRVLAAVGLPGDDGFLDQPQEALSGGMAKRLAVARALSMDPAVLFYDEPTTGLDPTSSNQVHELISRTHAEHTAAGEARTTLIITHDKDLLSRLEPRTVMLDQGRVFFDGPFQQFHDDTSDIIRPYFDLMPVLQQDTARQSRHPL